jgi:hypothetical protein
LSDLFDNILEDFNQLPTRIFSVLLSTSKLPGLVRLAFCSNLLLPLVNGTLPNYFYYEPTQQHFEDTLLTLKATRQSFAANAKISLVLEQMLMYMMSQDALTPTDSLKASMESGIQKRHSVSGTGKGRKGNIEEEAQGRDLMKACSERMLGMIDVLEIAAGKPVQPLQESTSAPLLSFGSASSLSPAPDSDTYVDD